MQQKCNIALLSSLNVLFSLEVKINILGSTICTEVFTVPFWLFEIEIKKSLTHRMHISVINQQNNLKQGFIQS